MSVYELGLGAAGFAVMVLGHALLAPYWEEACRQRQRRREVRNRQRQHAAEQRAIEAFADECEW